MNIYLYLFDTEYFGSSVIRIEVNHFSRASQFLRSTDSLTADEIMVACERISESYGKLLKQGLFGLATQSRQMTVDVVPGKPDTTPLLTHSSFVAGSTRPAHEQILMGQADIISQDDSFIADLLETIFAQTTAPSAMDFEQRRLSSDDRAVVHVVANRYALNNAQSLFRFVGFPSATDDFLDADVLLGCVLQTLREDVRNASSPYWEIVAKAGGFEMSSVLSEALASMLIRDVWDKHGAQATESQHTGYSGDHDAFSGQTRFAMKNAEGHTLH